MNKKKVLLSTIGLVALSGIAATSTTFAWFTTVRTATLSYTSATVETQSGSLAIDYVSSLNTMSSNVVNTSTLELSGGNMITDISGDGKNFYKPVWSSDSLIASAINPVSTASAGDADGYYIDFTINVKRENALAGTGLKVYLGTGTTITPVTALDAEDEGAVAASRMAVINDLDSVHLIYAPVTEVDPEHLATGGGPTYGIAGYQKVVPTIRNGVDFSTKSTIAAADTDGALVANLLTGVTLSRDVNFRFWIEGEDEQAKINITENGGGVFKINLALYALEA